MVRPISPSFLLCYIIHKLFLHSLNSADTDLLGLCYHPNGIPLSQLLYDPCIFFLQFLIGFLVSFLSTVLSTLSDVLLLPGVVSILVVLTFHFRAGPEYGYKNGQEGTSLPVRVENGQLLILIILLIHSNRLESKATAKAVNLAFGNDCSRHKKEDCLAFFLVPETELSTHNVCVLFRLQRYTL